MFSIPHVFANEDESYITLPALKRFAKGKKQSDLKTTVDRAELIRDIEKFAQASPDNEETVLEWLDQVVVEGIKDVQVKCINPPRSQRACHRQALCVGVAAERHPGQHQPAKELGVTDTFNITLHKTLKQ